MATSSSKRWDEAQARRIIGRADRSGLSDRAFAKREGFDPQRLSWWRRRFDEVDGATPSEPFVEVRAKAQVAAPEVLGIEIELSNGRRVRVPASVDPSVLAKLLAAIEGRPC